MHKIITSNASKASRIYNEDAAWDYYTMHKYEKGIARKLSLMKQANIKEAAKSGKFDVFKLWDAIASPCGYCFKYRFGEPMDYSCHNCLIVRMLNNRCIDLTGWYDMGAANTLKQFIKAHKKWCKKIGLDVYGKK